MNESKPNTTLDDLHAALQDALVIGLRGDNSDKYLKQALDFLQYRHYVPDSPAGDPNEGKKVIEELANRIKDATEL